MSKFFQHEQLSSVEKGKRKVDEPVEPLKNFLRYVNQLYLFTHSRTIATSYVSDVFTSLNISEITLVSREHFSLSHSLTTEVTLGFDISIDVC